MRTSSYFFKPAKILATELKGVRLPSLPLNFLPLTPVLVASELLYDLLEAFYELKASSGQIRIHYFYEVKGREQTLKKELKQAEENK